MATSLHETDTTASMELDDIIDDDERGIYESPLTSQDGLGVSSRALKKSSFKTRWLVLVLCCILMSSNYYAYDIPSALHQQMQTYMPPSSNFETKFNLLYTAYSIPNTILPLFGGNVVDRFGAPKCQTIFATCVFFGSCILSVGVSAQSWKAMYFGRFVFGLGAESLSVAQSTVLSEWFEGREVALAMGVALSVSRLGSIWNNLVSPIVANSKNGGVETAFWIGAVLTSSSVIMGGLIVFFDKKVTKKIEIRTGGRMQSLTAALLEESAAEPVSSQLGERSGNTSDMVGDIISTHDVQTVHISDIKKFPPLFWLLSFSCVVVYGCVLPFNNVAAGILLERNFFTSPPDCHLTFPDQCADGYLQSKPNVAVSSSGSECMVAPSQAPVLPSSVNFTVNDSNMSSTWDKTEYVYSDLQPTNVHCGDDFWFDGCTVSYCIKEHGATEHAGRVMSIPYLISSISSLLMGHMVDKVGRRAILATIASVLLLVVHASLAFTTISPVGPMILQGTAYSLYAAVIWPSVPLTVAKQYTGTAYGVITSTQNMGLALFPLVIAGIFNMSGSYIPNVEIFFALCATVGVFVGLLMIQADKKTGGKLNAIAGEKGEETADRDNLRHSGNYFDPLADERDNLHALHFE